MHADLMVWARTTSGAVLGGMLRGLTGGLGPPRAGQDLRA